MHCVKFITSPQTATCLLGCTLTWASTACLYSTNTQQLLKP